MRHVPSLTVTCYATSQLTPLGDLPSSQEKQRKSGSGEKGCGGAVAGRRGGRGNWSGCNILERNKFKKKKTKIRRLGVLTQCAHIHHGQSREEAGQRVEEMKESFHLRKSAIVVVKVICLDRTDSFSLFL